MPYWVPLLTCDSEMISDHDHLHMNLTGHILKGFGMLESLPVRLSLVQVGDCW
jgi:hypothetical protein